MSLHFILRQQTDAIWGEIEHYKQLIQSDTTGSTEVYEAHIKELEERRNNLLTRINKLENNQGD